MQLIIWIGFCSAFALALRKRLLVSVMLVLALIFLVPTVGSNLLTGQSSGALSFHAATWLVLAVFAVQLFHQTRVLRAVLADHPYIFLALGLVAIVAFATTRSVSQNGGMVLLMDQIVSPVILFLLIIAASRSDPLLVPVLVKWLICLAVVVCGVAIAQFLVKGVIFYESGFQTQYWYRPEQGRWMGTTDQPLALSLMLCLVAPLVVTVRRAWLQVMVLVVVVIGVVISQSRVGLAVIAFDVLYVIFFSRRTFLTKGIVVGIMSLASFVVASSSVIAGVMARIGNDTGSAQARRTATDYFFANWGSYLFSGTGVGSSYRVASDAGLITSFESAILMYGIDIGLTFAVIYFAVLAWIVVKFSFRHGANGLLLAGVFAVAIPQTYSSLATRSLAGILVWTIAGLTVAAGERLVAAGSSGPLGQTLREKDFRGRTSQGHNIQRLQTGGG